MHAGPLEDSVAAGEPIHLGFANAPPRAHPGENGSPLGFLNVITVEMQTYEDIKNADATMVGVTGYVNIEETRRAGLAEDKIDSTSTSRQARW